MIFLFLKEAQLLGHAATLGFEDSLHCSPCWLHLFASSPAVERAPFPRRCCLCGICILHPLPRTGSIAPWRRPGSELVRVMGSTPLGLLLCL